MYSKELDEQYTPGIVFILYSIVLHFIVSSANALHLSSLGGGVKTKVALTVLNCHKILIENVCRLLCKSMLPTMFIRLCVKLKHISLVSCGSRETCCKVKHSLILTIIYLE